MIPSTENGIRVKNSSVLRVLMEKEYHHMLIDIICYVSEEYGLLMTEAYRDRLHKNDVHGTKPGRGCDLRYRIYHRKTAYGIMDKINNLWCYDPDRPEKQCCIIHGEDNNRHLHIQVHPRTKKRF